MTVEELKKKYKTYDDFFSAEGGNYKPNQLKNIKAGFEKKDHNTEVSKNVEKAMNAGTINDKGSSSMADNPDSRAISQTYDTLGMLKDNQAVKALNETFRLEAQKILEENKGKSIDEKEKSADEIKEKYLNEKPIAETPKPIEAPKVAEAPKIIEQQPEEVKQLERNLDTNEKKNSFLKSWAATHPSWIDILKSEDLSTSQKVQLVLGAMFNIGANITLGAKAGFEHSGFQPVEWDFKNAIDKYTSNELDLALAKEQSKRGDELAANYLNEMQEKYGSDKMQTMFELAAKYSDNPAKLEELLKAEGIQANGKEFSDAYGKFKAVELREGAKREKIKTTIDQAAAKLAQINNKIAELERQGKKVDVNIKKQTEDLLIKAQNAQNDYTKTKYDFDAEHYSLEKYAGYASNVLGEVEKLASTVGGIATGGVVGSMPSAVDDGIIKGKGVAQKIVRADGTEIQLNPNDNIYATKNELTTEKDNGSEVIPMEINDRVITVQKKLGYTGGFINKDFNYYLNKLRG